MTIFPSLVAFIAAFGIAVFYAVRRIGSNFSLGFLLFWSLLLIHGIPLLIYLFVTGPGAVGPHAFIFNKIQEQSNYAEVSNNLISAVALMFLGITLGAELAFRVGPELPQMNAFTGIKNVIYLDGWRKLVLWTTVIAMLTVSIRVSHLPHILNYYKFSGVELDKALLRQSTGGTPYYLYNVLLYSVAPFLVMVSYCQDVTAAKRKYLPGALTCCLFLVTFIGKVSTLSKAPPVIFIMQLVLLVALLKSSALKFSSILKIAALLALLFFCMISITLPELSWIEVIAFFYYRVFDIPNEVLLEYFSAIPAKISHSWGASVWAWFGGIPNPNTRPTYYEVAAVTRNSYLSSSNAMFVGDAWAQFSWWGVGVTSVLAGFWTRMIDRVGFKNGYSDLTACIIAAGSFGILTILSTAFSTGLITGGLLLIPLISIFFLDFKKSELCIKLRLV